MQTYATLAARFETYLKQQAVFPKLPQRLYEPCQSFLETGGKRIRPVLCLMANELFGDITPGAWHAAVAIELFHNFTLIHDDIMDRAPLRRGKPTVHEQYGLTAGILCGDVMSIYAYDHLAQVGRLMPQILRVFNQTAIEVCEGQQLDMDFETSEDVSVSAYVEMITLKTSVLVAASLQMGALLAGATRNNADKLYAFGKNLGIAFQLQDDYLDAFGDATKLGKQLGGDILANKKTYPLLQALAHASTGQAEKIRQLQAGNDPEKVAAMLQLFRETRADERTRQAVNQYSDAAFDALDDVAIVHGRKEELRQLAAYLLMREH